MASSYDTLYDFCKDNYRLMAPGESQSISVPIHGVTLSFHLYRLADNFVFDSASKVSQTFSLCKSVDTYTQVLLGKNISINSNITLTPPYRCKGLVIFDMGKLTANGPISMTARGCSAVGQDIYLIKNQDNSYEFVPAVGAPATSRSQVHRTSSGWVGGSVINGNAGTGRQTGSGGAGMSYAWDADRRVPGSGNSAILASGWSKGGIGGAGTSYSGGAGGGGASSGSCASAAWDGSSTGGAGGQAHCARGTSGDSPKWCGGGAGNPGGNGWQSTGGNLNGSTWGSASSGTGGLLIIFADSSDISSLTSQGSNAQNGTYDHSTNGGGSGGGSINVFSRLQLRVPSVNVNGGTGGTNNPASTYAGGAGGKGTYTFTYFSPIFSLVKDILPNKIKTYDSGAWQDL